jgi:SHS2 domain-containing protein
MFDQIVDRRSLKGLGKTRIRAGGMDLPDLMVNWLRELLFLWNGREYLVKQAIMESISESALTARIWYDPYTPGEHEIGTDIKAVTYHGLRVEKKEAGWEASVIFDV